MPQEHRKGCSPRDVPGRKAGIMEEDGVRLLEEGADEVGSSQTR